MSWTDLQQGVLEAFADASHYRAAYIPLPFGVAIAETENIATPDFIEQVLEAASARVIWRTSELTAVIGCVPSTKYTVGAILTQAGWRRSSGRRYINESAIASWAHGVRGPLALTTVRDALGIDPKIVGLALRRAGWKRQHLARRNVWIKPRRARAKKAGA